MLHNRVPENSNETGTQKPKGQAFQSRKQPDSHDMDKAAYGSKLNNADLEQSKLLAHRRTARLMKCPALRERVLNNSNVERAALFDKDDVLQVAGSPKQLDVSMLALSCPQSLPCWQISQEQTRELLDALLSVQREVEGTNNTVTGAPPKSVQFEGASYSFANKSKDSCALTSEGKAALVLVQSARTFLIVEGAANANIES